MLLSLLCLSCAGLYAQENMKVNSIKQEKDSLNVVNDQIGSPTYTVDLAKLLCDMSLSDKYGIYHATNEGICSWYDFACEIFKQAGIKINVEPVPSTAFPRL